MFCHSEPLSSSTYIKRNNVLQLTLQGSRLPMLLIFLRLRHPFRRNTFIWWPITDITTHQIKCLTYCLPSATNLTSVGCQSLRVQSPQELSLWLHCVARLNIMTDCSTGCRRSLTICSVAYTRQCDRTNRLTEFASHIVNWPECWCSSI